MDPCILGLGVCFSPTPAAAPAHAHVHGLYMSRHATFPCARPLAEAQPGAGAAQVVSTSQSLSGNRHCNSGSRHGNRWAFLTSPVIIAGTWTPRWVSWRFVPYDGRLGGRGVLTSNPPLFSCTPLPHPQDGTIARLGQCSVGDGAPLEVETEFWSQISRNQN